MIKAKMISYYQCSFPLHELYEHFVWDCRGSLKESISLMKAHLNSQKIPHRDILIKACRVEVIPHRKIITIKKRKNYRITRFGIRFLKMFYELGYQEIPKEFVLYYDDNGNICEDRTIFTLKLDKQNDKS